MFTWWLQKLDEHGFTNIKHSLSPILRPPSSLGKYRLEEAHFTDSNAPRSFAVRFPHVTRCLLRNGVFKDDDLQTWCQPGLINPVYGW
jgi:hypothetical protein